MLFSELKEIMRDFNTKHDIKRKVDYKWTTSKDLIHINARIVIAKGVFKPEYDDLKYREYYISNYEKALTSEDLGYSIFAFNKYDNSCERVERYTDAMIESCEIMEIVE